jgi:hypothetical protein
VQNRCYLTFAHNQFDNITLQQQLRSLLYLPSLHKKWKEPWLSKQRWWYTTTTTSSKHYWSSEKNSNCVEFKWSNSTRNNSKVALVLTSQELLIWCVVELLEAFPT